MTITFEQFHTCDACGCDMEDQDECICQVCKDKNLVAKVKAALPTKSCFTCKNLKTWDYPGTLEDPPDEGWDCGIKDYEPTELIDEALDEIDEDIDAVRLAKNCQRYEFFDWDAYHKAAADSEAEYDFPDVDPKLCPDAIPYASYYF